MRAVIITVLALAGHLLSAASASDPIRWEPLYEPGSGGAMVAIGVSPHDPQRLLISGDMLGVGLSTDGGDSWQSTFGFESWEMADITWHPEDPQVVWIGSMSGPYVSHDGGRNWEERRAGMPQPDHFYTAPIERVLIDPRDHQHLLAFGGSSRNWGSGGSPAWGAVWESRDGGASWTWISTVTDSGSGSPGTPGANLHAVELAHEDPDTIYALTARSMLVSVDGGRSWERRGAGLPAGAGLARLAQHPSRPGRLWVGVGPHPDPDGGGLAAGGVFRSDDAGLSWTGCSAGIRKVVTADNGNLTTSIRGLAVAPSDGERLYCNDGSWSTGITYRSDDGGDSWYPLVSKGNLGQEDGEPEDKARLFQLETACPAGNGMGYIAVDPSDPDTVYAINSEFIARSRDGGASWDDATAIKIAEGRWRGRGYTGWCSTSVSFDPFQQGRLVVQAMDAAQCWLSEDDAASWSYHSGPETAWSGGTDASFCADGRLYVSTGSHGWMGIGRRDADGDWTWFRGAAHGLPAAAWGQDSPAGIHAHPQRSELVWAAIGGRLYHSSDAGQHWAVVAGVPHADWIAGDPTQPDLIYVTSGNGVLRGGPDQPFELIGGPRGGGRSVVDAQGRVLVAAHQGERPGVWRYDGSWTRLWDERWVHGIAVDPSDPERILVSTNQNPYLDHSSATGAWISADGGQSWSAHNQGLAMLRAWCVAIDPHDPERIVFGSFGRGFFVATWPRDFAPRGERSYTSTPEDQAWATPPDPYANLVRNGDMSAGDDQPEHWDGRSGELAAVARDTAQTAEAPAALRIEGRPGASGQVFQHVQGLAGERVVLRGRFRSRDPGHAQVALQVFSGDWQRNEFLQAHYVQGPSDWSAFEREFTIPDWAERVHVLVLVEGQVTAWLDEVELRRAR